MFSKLFAQLQPLSSTIRMSRPHASSVDADNAWGKPVTPEPTGQEDASDVIEKEQLVKYTPPLSLSGPVEWRADLTGVYRDILSKQDGLRGENPFLLLLNPHSRSR